MLKFGVFALLLAITAVACVQTDVPKIYQEISLGIGTVQQSSYSLEIQGSFVKKEQLSVVSEISSPIDTNLEVTWFAPSSVDLSLIKRTVHLNAGETKRLIIYATPQRRGFFSVESYATSKNNATPLNLGKNSFFEVSATVSLQKAASTGTPSVMEYIDNLPIADVGLYRQQEIDRLNGTDNAVLDARYNGIRYYNKVGNAKTASTPQEMTTAGAYSMSFLPNTGDGKPEVGELDEPVPGSRAALQGQNGVRPQNLFCGGEHWSTVKFALNAPTYIGINGYGGYNLTRMKVQVFDNNGHWNALIAQGYTDMDGVFTYVKPNCDTSSWFDGSPPDIFYVITGETNDGLQTNVSRVFWTRASLSTGTYWEDRSATTFISVASSEAIHTRVMFSSNVMIQRARDVSKMVGDINNANFPVRIHEFFGTFAPVGVIFFGNANSSDYETGPSSAFGGYASPYMIYHEFGHNVMWATRNPTNYLSIFNNPSIPVASPGYEDEQCITSGLNGAVIDPIVGLINLIQCFSTVYTHNGTDLKDTRLAWSEGWANYFNNVIVLYLNTIDKEPKYRTFLIDSYLMGTHLYCDAESWRCSAKFDPVYSPPTPATGQPIGYQGTLNETRVGSFLTRFTIEILAQINPPVIPAPTDNNPFPVRDLGTWVDSLTPTNVQSILTQYGRVRDSVIAGSGFLMGLDENWSKLYALTSNNTATKTKICEIAFQTRVISPTTTLPCKADGSVK